ncbi:hypothetical protein M6G53_17605, partial [Serratia nevei]|uniref:hypothetical protein n=1 Tax=Serratia nevei TaxID=2703794 RepID=UPI00209CDC3F
RTAISTLNSNVSIGSSLKTASFTPGGSELHWHVGHFYIGTNTYFKPNKNSGLHYHDCPSNLEFTDNKQLI